MRTLKMLIVLGIVASALHFADNALELDRYTGPRWITPAGVVVSWLAVTALAFAALLQRRPGIVFRLCTALYAVLLLSGLLHYAFGPPMDMPLRSNLTVLVEACTGALLAAAWIAQTLRRRERIVR